MILLFVSYLSSSSHRYQSGAYRLRNPTYCLEICLPSCLESPCSYPQPTETSLPAFACPQSSTHLQYLEDLLILWRQIHWTGWLVEQGVLHWFHILLWLLPRFLPFGRSCNICYHPQQMCNHEDTFHDAEIGGILLHSPHKLGKICSMGPWNSKPNCRCSFHIGMLSNLWHRSGHPLGHCSCWRVRKALYLSWWVWDSANMMRLTNLSRHRGDASPHSADTWLLRC